MTRDEMIEMARKAGSLIEIAQEKDLLWLTAFAKLVAEHEREACAKVCEEQMQGKSIWIEGARACSLAIRARGQE